MGRNIDFLIKELLNEKFDSIECPSKEELWQQVELGLTHGSGRKNINSFSYNSKLWFYLKSVSDFFFGKLVYFNNIDSRKNKNISQ
jgi:hypothetical protein